MSARSDSIRKLTGNLRTVMYVFSYVIHLRATNDLHPPTNATPTKRGTLFAHILLVSYACTGVPHLTDMRVRRIGGFPMDFSA